MSNPRKAPRPFVFRNPTDPETKTVTPPRLARVARSIARHRKSGIDGIGIFNETGVRECNAPISKLRSQYGLPIITERMVGVSGRPGVYRLDPSVIVIEGDA